MARMEDKVTELVGYREALACIRMQRVHANDGRMLVPKECARYIPFEWLASDLHVEAPGDLLYRNRRLRYTRFT
jgi:hypothetical protein